MKSIFISIVSGAVVLCISVVSCLAADNSGLERMATCQDSWLEWKDDPAKLERFADDIRSSFTEADGAAYLIPKSTITVIGFPVIRLFPDSIGMAVGFSVVVGADFETTRARLEKKLGKSLEKCESGNNMRGCELGLGEKKTLLLLAQEEGKTKTSLFGCYYYYEK